MAYKDWRDQDVTDLLDKTEIALVNHISQVLSNAFMDTLYWGYHDYVAIRTAEEFRNIVIQTMRKGIPEDYK